MEVIENLFLNKFLPQLNTSFYHLSTFKCRTVKKYTLPILIHQEDEWYIAECPLFNVASHGYSFRQAIESVKDALELYLSSKIIQKNLPENKFIYSKKEMLKKALDLFEEYSPGDEPPKYIYKEIEVPVLMD